MCSPGTHTIFMHKHVNNVYQEIMSYCALLFLRFWIQTFWSFEEFVEHLGSFSFQHNLDMKEHFSVVLMSSQKHAEHTNVISQDSKDQVMLASSLTRQEILLTLLQ